MSTDTSQAQSARTVPVKTQSSIQKEKYGGLNIGAAFFGWLVAIGIAVLLTALLSAAGSAIALTSPDISINNNVTTSAAETIGLVSGGLLVLVLAIAYFAGGYVAGRMSRFDGAKQGLGVWTIGIVITIISAGLAFLFGSNYNLLQSLNLPNIPVDSGDLTTAGIITLLTILAVTLVAALLGGKTGQRYHDKVDRLANDRDY